jgi:hypothetical protein
MSSHPQNGNFKVDPNCVKRHIHISLNWKKEDPLKSSVSTYVQSYLSMEINFPSFEIFLVLKELIKHWKDEKNSLCFNKFWVEKYSKTTFKRSALFKKLSNWPKIFNHFISKYSSFSINLIDYLTYPWER